LGAFKACDKYAMMIASSPEFELESLESKSQSIRGKFHLVNQTAKRDCSSALEIRTLGDMQRIPFAKASASMSRKPIFESFWLAHGDEPRILMTF
jgi:hypothetical protein